MRELSDDQKRALDVMAKDIVSLPLAVRRKDEVTDTVGDDPETRGKTMTGGKIGGVPGGRRVDEADPLELDIERLFGDRIRASDEFAEQIWSAFTNVDWIHPLYGECGFSFRAAGDMIAAIKGSGDYSAWYCCAPHGVVSDDISIGMATAKWSWKECKG